MGAVNHAAKGDWVPFRSSLILAIGDPYSGRVTQLPLSGRGKVAYRSFADMTAEEVVALNPGLVISPLLAERFDCLDVARLLDAAGVTGKYRAVAEELPDPGLIRREVGLQFPGLDIDIVCMSALRVDA